MRCSRIRGRHCALPVPAVGCSKHGQRPAGCGAVNAGACLVAYLVLQGSSSRQPHVGRTRDHPAAGHMHPLREHRGCTGCLCCACVWKPASRVVLAWACAHARHGHSDALFVDCLLFFLSTPGCILNAGAGTALCRALIGFRPQGCSRAGALLHIPAGVSLPGLCKASQLLECMAPLSKRI